MSDLNTIVTELAAARAAGDHMKADGLHVLFSRRTGSDHMVGLYTAELDDLIKEIVTESDAARDYALAWLLDKRRDDEPSEPAVNGGMRQVVKAAGLSLQERGSSDYPSISGFCAVGH